MYLFTYLTRDERETMVTMADVFEADGLVFTPCKGKAEKVSAKGNRVSAVSPEQELATRVRNASVAGGLKLKGRMASQVIKAKVARDGYITGLMPDDRLILAFDPERVDPSTPIEMWLGVAEAQIEVAAARYDAIAIAQQAQQAQLTA